MTLNEFIVGFAQISGLLLIVTSMLVMGISLSMAPILCFKTRVDQKVIVSRFLKIRF